MQRLNLASLAVAAALLGSPSSAAKRRPPLPVPKNPLDLAKPTWIPTSVARGEAEPRVNQGLRIGSLYPAPATHKHPQPAEAIALFNASDEPVRLSGLRIEVMSYKRGKKKMDR